MYCPPGTEDLACIPFALQLDTDYVVLVKDATKTLMTLADLMYHAFKEHGIPQVALENHTLEEIRRTPQASLLTCFHMFNDSSPSAN